MLSGKAPRFLGVPVLLAGAVMTLGFAPFNLWPVAVASLAWFVWLLVRAGSWRQALGLSFVWGFGWQVTALHWLPRAFYLDAGRDIWAAILGGIPGMLAVAVWSTLGILFAGMVGYAAVSKLGRGWGATVFVLAWVGMEVVKSLHPMGFPWLLLGAMAGNWPVLGQAASVVGVYGLSALFLTLAVLVAFGWERRKLWSVAASVLLAWGGFGGWRLMQAAPDSGDGMMMRLVQPNIQDPMKWDPVVRWRYLEQTAALMHAPGWQLVDAFILPENALPFDVAREPEAVKLVREGLSADQAVVAGSIGFDEVMVNGEPDVQAANRFVVVGDTGALEQSDKVLLVPFGEYIPWRDVIMNLPLPGALLAFLDARRDYTAGVAPNLLDINGKQALPLVCYEGIFAPYVAMHGQGADMLLNLTSDMWFTGTIALGQHAALSRLRAIENGVPLVRVATTGISVVYDAYGREVVKLPINVAMVQDVRLPDALPTTAWRQLARHF